MSAVVAEGQHAKTASGHIPPSASGHIQPSPAIIRTGLASQAGSISSAAQSPVSLSTPPATPGVPGHAVRRISGEVVIPDLQSNPVSPTDSPGYEPRVRASDIKDATPQGTPSELTPNASPARPRAHTRAALGAPGAPTVTRRSLSALEHSQNAAEAEQESSVIIHSQTGGPQDDPAPAVQPAPQPQENFGQSCPPGAMHSPIQPIRVEQESCCSACWSTVVDFFTCKCCKKQQPVIPIPAERVQQQAPTNFSAQLALQIKEPLTVSI